MNQEIIIPLNKIKLILFLLGSVFFVIAGFYFFIYKPDILYLVRINNKIWLAKALGSLIIGLIAVLFFGMILISCLKKLLIDDYALIISREYLIDNTIGFSKKVVPYSRIENLTHIKVDKNEFIYIYLSNPIEFIANQNIIDSFFMKLNNRFYKTPLMINKHIIKYNFEELLVLLNKALKNYRRNYE